MNKYCVEVLLGEELIHWANQWLLPEDKKRFAEAMKREKIGEEDFGMLGFEATEDENVFKFLNVRLVTDELIQKALF